MLYLLGRHLGPLAYQVHLTMYFVVDYECNALCGCKLAYDFRSFSTSYFFRVSK